MCGIVGYTGPQSASHPLIEGLRRLEYRGYDSAGIALGTPGKLFIEKKAGKLSNLEASLDASLPTVHSGIGHTRWATHGGPTDGNAHPHVDNEGKLELSKTTPSCVHNLKPKVTSSHLKQIRNQ
jgi:glucosamine--fructose-6-phosphate aminotransferase (isomerizing)